MLRAIARRAQEGRAIVTEPWRLIGFATS